MIRYIKLKYFPILIWLIILIGLIPVSFGWIFENYASLNILKIEYQECTCCPEAKVIKGHFQISPALKLKYPKMGDTIYEINLSGNSPFHEIYGENAPYSLFEGLPFLVKGRVVDIKFEDCNGTEIQYNPTFEVSHWEPACYCPLFFEFNRLFLVAYLVLLFLAPVLSFIGWLTSGNIMKIIQY